MIPNPSEKSSDSADTMSLYRLTKEQAEVHTWLKGQGLNVDNDTLSYWVRKYNPERLIDVVKFALSRNSQGKQIRNIGGWIHKFLKEGLAVENDGCKSNRKFAQEFAKSNNWVDLHVYEKYIRDEVTDDDLPLTLPKEEFCRALEALYKKSQIYKN